MRTCVDRMSNERNGEVVFAHRQDEDGADVDEAEDRPVGLRQLVVVVCVHDGAISHTIFGTKWMLTLWDMKEIVESSDQFMRQGDQILTIE